jgi:hypothetical protein
MAGKDVRNEVDEAAVKGVGKGGVNSGVRKRDIFINGEEVISSDTGDMKNH